jgi:acyl carrier protein
LSTETNTPTTAGPAEAVARSNLARLLGPGTDPEALDLDADLTDQGLTSMNKVVFLMSVCDEAGISLTEFTEPDLAAMHTLRDVAEALSTPAGTGA